MILTVIMCILICLELLKIKMQNKKHPQNNVQCWNLTIGDEVRIGQVVNTNAAWLASQLTQTGAFISEHRTIGDDREIMHREIDDLSKKMIC